MPPKGKKRHVSRLQKDIPETVHTSEEGDSASFAKVQQDQVKVVLGTVSSVISEGVASLHGDSTESVDAAYSEKNLQSVIQEKDNTVVSDAGMIVRVLKRVVEQADCVSPEIVPNPDAGVLAHLTRQSSELHVDDVPLASDGSKIGFQDSGDPVLDVVPPLLAINDSLEGEVVGDSSVEPVLALEFGAVPAIEGFLDPIEFPPLPGKELSLHVEPSIVSTVLPDLIQDIGNPVTKQTENGKVKSYCGAVKNLKASAIDFVISSNSKQVVEGEPAFIVSDDEWRCSVLSCKWQCILKFSLARPSLKYIKEQIVSSWGLSSTPTVGLLDNRHIMITTYSDEDCNRILARDDCRMGRGYFRVFRWSEDFDKKRESPIVQRWVRLPGLPSNCCSHIMLKGIGDSISKFIAADNRTISREVPGYARMCIEVDVSKELPRRVWIGTSSSKGYWQTLIIEGRTDYCGTCRLHGHSLLNCRHVAAKKQITTLQGGNTTEADKLSKCADDEENIIAEPVLQEVLKQSVTNQLIQTEDIVQIGNVMVTLNKNKDIVETNETQAVGLQTETSACESSKKDSEISGDQNLCGQSGDLWVHSNPNEGQLQPIAEGTDVLTIETLNGINNCAETQIGEVVVEVSNFTDSSLNSKQASSLNQIQNGEGGSENKSVQEFGGQIDWVKEVGFEIDWDSPIRVDSIYGRSSKRIVR